MPSIVPVTGLPPTPASEVVAMNRQSVQPNIEQAEPVVLKDHGATMPPKSIMQIRMRIEYVRKALPPTIEPDDS